MKRLWPWMYHFSLELRQKISSERKFQRPGTRQKHKWEIFCDWCSGRDIDPVRVTVQQLADFLVYLFEIKQLVPSTIKGYRSAIGRTISLLGGPDFGKNHESHFSCQKLRQARNSTSSRENVNLLPLLVQKGERLGQLRLTLNSTEEPIYSV
jgi:hypothetical protein